MKTNNTFEGCQATLDGGEGNAEGDVSWQSDASGGHDVAEDGELSNTAVLGLYGAEAVEACLVGVVKQAWNGLEEEKYNKVQSGG